MSEQSMIEQRATAQLLKSLFPVIARAISKECEELSCSGSDGLSDALKQSVQHLKALICAYYDMTEDGND